jgi:hypothetical protein
MGGSFVTVRGQQAFVIARKILERQQRRGKLEPFCHQALGMNETGQVKITGFVTPGVDLLMASMSVANSAILLLYYLKEGVV